MHHVFVDIATSGFLLAVCLAWYGVGELLGYTHGKVGTFGIVRIYVL